MAARLPARCYRCQSVHLLIWISVRRSSVGRPGWLSVRPNVGLSVLLFNYRSVGVALRPSACVGRLPVCHPSCWYVYLSAGLLVGRSVCLSARLSVGPSVGLLKRRARQTALQTRLPFFFLSEPSFFFSDLEGAFFWSPHSARLFF